MPSTEKLAAHADTTCRVVDYLRQIGRSASVNEMAATLGIAAYTVASVLGTRRLDVGDVRPWGRRWRHTDASVLANKPARTSSNSGVIAGRREPPNRTAVWTGHTTPGPIRPGALDYRNIPSRIGDARIPHDGHIAVRNGAHQATRPQHHADQPATA